MRGVNGPGIVPAPAGDFPHLNLAGTLPRCRLHRVDEDDRLGSAHVLGQLGRELVKAENLNVGQCEFCFESLSRAPSHAVIGAQRIAVCKDQNARHVRKKLALMSF